MNANSPQTMSTQPGARSLMRFQPAAMGGDWFHSRAFACIRGSQFRASPEQSLDRMRGARSSPKHKISNYCTTALRDYGNCKNRNNSVSVSCRKGPAGVCKSNAGVRKGCTGVCKGCTGVRKGCTEVCKGCTEVRKGCTEVRKGCTEVREGCTEVREGCTEACKSYAGGLQRFRTARANHKSAKITKTKNQTISHWRSSNPGARTEESKDQNHRWTPIDTDS